MRNASALRTLVLLSLAELLAMSLWFTGTAVLPQLAALWAADIGTASWLTTAVQLGFVVGALCSAALNISDRFHPSYVFAISAAVGALCNAAFAWVAERHVLLAMCLRLLTGAALAGVYPTGMKILAGWYQRGRGLALGVLVGALTIGSALPHGVSGTSLLSDDNWQRAVLLSSALSLVAAVMVGTLVKRGPFSAPSPPFDVHQIGKALQNREVRLATFGYLGHMWELYSMWAWLAVLLRSAAAASGSAIRPGQLSLFTFLSIAVGALGCAAAGRVSDSAGSGHDPASRLRRRTLVTIVAMAASGLCCLLTALVYPSVFLLVAVAVLWGISIIADSAQFSAIISEVCDQRYVGTALTLQVALGFLLTTISIRTTAAIAERWGWQLAAASLALGPALGIIAMLRLRRTVLS